MVASDNIQGAAGGSRWNRQQRGLIQCFWCCAHISCSMMSNFSVLCSYHDHCSGDQRLNSCGYVVAVDMWHIANKQKLCTRWIVSSVSACSSVKQPSCSRLHRLVFSRWLCYRRGNKGSRILEAYFRVPCDYTRSQSCMFRMLSYPAPAPPAEGSVTESPS